MVNGKHSMRAEGALRSVRNGLPGTSSRWRTVLQIIGGVALLAGLYVISRQNYLLFHSLAELFSIVIAFGIFALCWNSRLLLQDNYLVFLAIAYLSVALLDTLHTLAYSGMGVFAGATENLSTQLWISARYVESVSLLATALLIGRKIRPLFTFGLYGVLTVLLVGSIFWWGGFPACYVPGDLHPLTGFKIGSEYVICGILAASALIMIRKESAFDRRVLLLLVGSILVTMASEVAFTQYRTVTGPANLIGHFLKIVSFYLIYKAIIETGIVRPYSLLFRDLSLSERNLRNERARLAAVLDQMPAGVVIAEAPSGHIILSNEQVQSIWRRPFQTCAAFGESQECPAAHPDGVPYGTDDCPLRRALLHGETVTGEEVEFVRGDGARGSMLVSAGPIRDENGHVMAAVMTFHDVTARKRALDALHKAREQLETRVEERTAELKNANKALRTEIAERREAEAKLQEYQKELRSLASELSLAEERERRRIARLAHDEVGQSLALCRIQLSELCSTASSAQLAEQLRCIRSVLDKCIEQTRSLTLQLGSPILYELGLEAALENLVQRAQQQHGLKANFHDDGQAKPLEHDTRVVLFQAAKELVTNVVKHARADRLRIGVQRQNGMVEVSIEDDGVGFDVSDLKPGREGPGFGLFSIRERLRHLGGRFEVRSKPGSGTLARMAAPLSAEQDSGRQPETKEG